jgi:hypothetical protein
VCIDGDFISSWLFILRTYRDVESYDYHHYHIIITLWNTWRLVCYCVLNIISLNSIIYHLYHCYHPHYTVQPLSLVVHSVLNIKIQKSFRFLSWVSFSWLMIFHGSLQGYGIVHSIHVFYALIFVVFYFLQNWFHFKYFQNILISTVFEERVILFS